MVRLQILSGKQAGQTILVRRFPFCIGRGSQSQLVLTDPGVWDEHCRIEYRPTDGFFLCPTPGGETRIDLAPLVEDTRLSDATELSVGAVHLRFSLANPAPRNLGLREAVAWLFLLAVVAAETWLIYWLPR